MVVAMSARFRPDGRANRLHGTEHMTLLTTSIWVLALAACTATVGTRDRDPPDSGVLDDTPPDVPPIMLEDLAGRYRGTCDGSAAIALDFTQLIGFSDEDQVARVYERGAAGPPKQALDVSGPLGLVAADEADVEDAARVGDRMFVITSHARRNSGDADSNRHRLFAIELPTMTVSGASSRLLADLLDASRWENPDPDVLDALIVATRLDQPKVGTLAPEQDGLNIEGLAFAPQAGAPSRMVIGLRNPRPNGNAIAVSLVNANEVVTGALARFGEATQLGLGGLGIRGMAWSDVLQSVLVLAGPHDADAGPFRLYRWTGVPGVPAVFLRDLVLPVGVRPESIVTYSGTADVQILFDSDGTTIGGMPCKDAPASDREFQDQIVHL